MSNIDPKIASHASMWLKNAEQIERQIVRLTSDELEAYRYVRDIFKQPRPDMERLQVAQETLRDVGAELHDDFGAAVKTFAAKVSVIVKNFEAFRQAVVIGATSTDIALASTKTKQTEPALVTDRQVRIDGNNQSYYNGCVDENGLPHGMGELHYGFDSYSDRHISVTGNFCNGKFPEHGSVSDGRSVFNGDFHVGLDESYNVIDFIKYFRNADISLKEGNLTVNECTVEGTFRFSYSKISIKSLTSVRFKNGKIFEKDNSAGDTGILKDTAGKSQAVSFNLRLLIDSDNLISEFKPI